ncbi:unnamed protein product [Rhodiola kirilowii]
MMDQRKYILPPVAADCGAFSSSDAPSTCLKRKNKERFRDEQVKFLESMFQMASKIEPRKKVQVAKELGLQPHQVGIWFQNKRARWKSKKMERNYRALKASYDSLASQFEALKKEKQSLVVQLEYLSNQVQYQEKKGRSFEYLAEEIIDGGSKKIATDFYELVYTEQKEVPQNLQAEERDANRFQTLPESWYMLGGSNFLKESPSDEHFLDFKT